MVAAHIKAHVTIDADASAAASEKLANRPLQPRSFNASMHCVGLVEGAL
jgi:hypothetical protein